MATQRLQSYLDDNGVEYDVIHHAPAFTAQETAEVAHIPGQLVAKTVVVQIDGGFALVVEPASRRVNLGRLKQALDAEEVNLAEEHDLTELFPDCERGAMPPFGNLYGLPVYIASELADDEEIVFNAGTHTELLRMRYRDFEALVRPQIVAIGPA